MTVFCSLAVAGRKSFNEQKRTDELNLPWPLVVGVLQTEFCVADFLLKLIQSNWVVKTVESQVDESKLAASKSEEVKEWLKSNPPDDPPDRFIGL